MINNNAKGLQPDEAGLIFRMKCRVSRWFGVKFLSSLLLSLFWFFLGGVVGIGLIEILRPNHQFYTFMVVFVCWCVFQFLFWKSYNLLWRRTVSVYDRGDQVEIWIDHRLYRFDWADLCKIRVYKILGRHGSISSLNLVMKFQERTFRLTADVGIYQLEKLIKVLRKKLKQYHKDT